MFLYKKCKDLKHSTRRTNKQDCTLQASHNKMVRATRSSSKRNNSSEKTTPKRDTKRSKTDYASMPVEHESHGKVDQKSVH